MQDTLPFDYKNVFFLMMSHYYSWETVTCATIQDMLQSQVLWFLVGGKHESLKCSMPIDMFIHYFSSSVYGLFWWLYQITVFYKASVHLKEN